MLLLTRSLIEEIEDLPSKDEVGICEEFEVEFAP